MHARLFPGTKTIRPVQRSFLKEVNCKQKIHCCSLFFSVLHFTFPPSPMYKFFVRAALKQQTRCQCCLEWLALKCLRSLSLSLVIQTLHHLHSKYIERNTSALLFIMRTLLHRDWLRVGQFTVNF